MVFIQRGFVGGKALGEKREKRGKKGEKRGKALGREIIKNKNSTPDVKKKQTKEKLYHDFLVFVK